LNEPRQGRKIFIRNHFLSPLPGLRVDFRPDPGLTPGAIIFPPLWGSPAERVSRLDLDLDVDVDGLVRAKLSRHSIYQIALYLCMSTSKSTSRSKSKSRTEG
jgi:hypothetical protein